MPLACLNSLERCHDFRVLGKSAFGVFRENDFVAGFDVKNPG